MNKVRFSILVLPLLVISLLIGCSSQSEEQSQSNDSNFKQELPSSDMGTSKNEIHWFIALLCFLSTSILILGLTGLNTIRNIARISRSKQHQTTQNRTIDAYQKEEEYYALRHDEIGEYDDKYLSEFEVPVNKNGTVVIPVTCDTNIIGHRLNLHYDWYIPLDRILKPENKGKYPARKALSEIRKLNKFNLN